MPTADPIRTADVNVGETPDLIYELDARGRRRSPSATKGYRQPKPPATKGRRYPPDPLPTEDFLALFSACTPQRPGRIGELSALRLKTLIVVLWRTGMRINEALALEERDLHRAQRAIHIRRGKGGKERTVKMDTWGWAACDHWFGERLSLPPGQIFCVLSGPTAGRAIHDSDVRRQFRELRARAGVRRRVHAHGMRHSFAADGRREGWDYLTLMRQLGHAHLGVTQLYMRGIPDDEVLEPIAKRSAPMVMLPLP